MAKVVQLKQKRAEALKAKAKAKTLCGSGFHRWQIVSERRFEVKLGKLVTQYRCTRCGAEKLTTL